MSAAADDTREHTRKPTHPGAIIIARHGRPDCDRSQAMDWRGYIAWWAQYNRSGLVQEETAPAALIAAGQDAEVIFSSDIRRAIETAEAVAGGRAVLQDPVFAEAPLPPPRIWGRRKPRHWGVLARISWWLGAAHGEETRRQAEQRAEAAVATLTARALRGETVILLAHGWFNRMMRPVLKRQGWSEVEDHGDSYWSFRRYERRR
jgi:broad specificity phosphatase PhoE